MERTEYLKLCQLASFKTDFAGAWWAVHWNADELVRWRGGLYVPVDYRFGFRKGEVTGVAILHSPHTHTEYHAPLHEVERNKGEEP